MPASSATQKCLLGVGFALGLALGVNAAEIPGIDDPAVQACIDKTAASRSVTQHITLRSFDDSGLIEESIADIYVQRSVEDKSRAVIRLSGPPSRKGLAVLMLESDKLEPTMYLYVPDLRRTRKVTGKQLAASMMGTDFSYEEFSHFQRSAAESETKRIDDQTLDGVAAYVLETTPAGNDSPYSRILTYIDQQRCVPLKTEFLNPGDTVTKELVATPDSIKPVGEFHIPHQVIMYDRVKNTRTELGIEDLVLDADINETIFSPNSKSGLFP
ncbi:MAG: outer membrane lipoprotein-sorting protein [Gammaproteobacteria bacterium]